MQNKTEKYSPRWLENLWGAALENFHAGLVHRTGSGALPAAINILVCIFFLAFAFVSQELILKSGIFFKNDYFLVLDLIFAYSPVLCLVMAFGSLAFYIPVSGLPILQLCGFVVSLITAYLTLPSFFPEASFTSISANFGGAFLVFLIFFFGGKFFRRGYIFKGDFFLASYLGSALGFVINYRLGMNLQIVDFPRMIFPFSLLSLEAQAGKKSSRLMEWVAIFPPTILFTPLPIESKDRVFTADWSLRLRGLRDVLRGILFVFMAFILRRHLTAFPMQQNVGGVFGYGFITYIYYFFGSYAWMALPFGILRWYGMKVPDYFNFPLLSTSPGERWRRWNTYYYNWYYKVIFFPLYKKTRSMLIGIFTVFFVTALLHSGRLSYGPLFGVQKLLVNPLSLQLALFFGAHAFLIFLSLKFPQLWPAGEKRRGWWGVLVLTLLMSLVHIFAI